MPYELIDKIIEAERAQWEENREQVLADVEKLLAELAPKYGFSQAYIFGSTVKAGKFRPESDVDIAIFNLDTQYFFRLIAEISRQLERDVDLYQIEKMDDRLRATVEAQGVLWKKPD
ncbi:MAG: nucleotidyltransferase domain-containing protein [Candidatus Poribacteria bacterium]|nr:nucleotidyltransferase domain-containing protein [Candidatus Poribacteria bacterium]